MSKRASESCTRAGFWSAFAESLEQLSQTARDAAAGDNAVADEQDTHARLRAGLVALLGTLEDAQRRARLTLDPSADASADASTNLGDLATDGEAAAPRIRTTYRTACVLRAIFATPRSSNREVAEAAGLADEGQTSKLLGRLEQRGLIENVGLGAACGEPNAWLLTADGRRVVDALQRDGLMPGATRGARQRLRGERQRKKA